MSLARMQCHYVIASSMWSRRRRPAVDKASIETYAGAVVADLAFSEDAPADAADIASNTRTATGRPIRGERRLA